MKTTVETLGKTPTSIDEMVGKAWVWETEGDRVICYAPNNYQFGASLEAIVLYDSSGASEPGASWTITQGFEAYYSEFKGNITLTFE